MKTILIQIPLLADKKAEWDLMINHPEGIALAGKKKVLFLPSLATRLMWTLILC